MGLVFLVSRSKNDDKATWEEGAAEEGDQELSYYFCKR